MNTCFLYHAFGVREQECSRVRYEDKSIILEVKTRTDKLRCPFCRSKHIIRLGSVLRRLRRVPIGSKSVILEMKIQRIECKDYHCIRQENILFSTGKRSYTNRLARLVVEISRIGTIKDMANFLHMP